MQETHGGKIGPIRPTDHLVVGHDENGERVKLTCPGCHRGFNAGDYVTLRVLGPGADPDAQEAARRGDAYNAVAVPMHWKCATGKEHWEE